MSAMTRRAIRLLLCSTLLAAALYAQESGEGGGANAAEESRGLWKWANFAIMAVLLGYAIGKNAPRMFRERTAEIQKGISEAQAQKADAEKRAAEMDARMSRLGADIEAFRSQAKVDMDREGARIRQETTAQIERIHHQAAMEIETAGKSARRELRDYAADLALDLAKQRIAARMSPATEAALIADFTRDLGGADHARQGANN